MQPISKSGKDTPNIQQPLHDETEKEHSPKPPMSKQLPLPCNQQSHHWVLDRFLIRKIKGIFAFHCFSNRGETTNSISIIKISENKNSCGNAHFELILTFKRMKVRRNIMKPSVISNRVVNKLVGESTLQSIAKLLSTLHPAHIFRLDYRQGTVLHQSQ